MASINDNLFTSFQTLPHMLVLSYSIGLQRVNLELKMVDGRLRSLGMVGDSVRVPAKNPEGERVFFKWLSHYERSTPAEQWQYLQPAGTPFQKVVWQALLKVEWGSRIAYGTLAKRMGRPEAVRAVAGAIAANPIALLIPCHRIVNAGGGIGGYRWGRALKQSLLDREQRQQTWSEIFQQDSST